MARTAFAPRWLTAAAAFLVFFLGASLREGRTAPVLPMGCAEAMNQAAVDSAYNVETGPSTALETGLQAVALGQRVAVRVNGLADLKAKCAPIPIILFLNGFPIRSVKPYPPTAPPVATAGPNPPAGSGDLLFILKVTDGSIATDGSKLTDGSRDYWTPILGKPPWPSDSKRLSVSVGVEDQYPLRASAGRTLPEFEFNPLRTKWFAIWGVIFVGMLVMFIFFSFRSNIIREKGSRRAPTWAVPGVLTAFRSSKVRGGSLSFSRLICSSVS